MDEVEDDRHADGVDGDEGEDEPADPQKAAEGRNG
jgi:hypothetical protein